MTSDISAHRDRVCWKETLASNENDFWHSTDVRWEYKTTPSLTYQSTQRHLFWGTVPAPKQQRSSSLSAGEIQHWGSSCECSVAVLSLLKCFKKYIASSLFGNHFVCEISRGCSGVHTVGKTSLQINENRDVMSVVWPLPNVCWRLRCLCRCFCKQYHLWNRNLQKNQTSCAVNLCSGCHLAGPESIHSYRDHELDYVLCTVVRDNHYSHMQFG